MMKIVLSLPMLSEQMIQKAETVLHDRFGYSALPDDYKNFLLKNNGGFVSPGFIDGTRESDHTAEIVFDTPLKRIKQNDQPVTPCLVMFFGIFLDGEMNPDEIKDEKVFELFGSNEHSKEDFEILPDNMMSIAKCSHPDAADMLCISLEKDDYGSIYYFNEFWDRPSRFFGSYFDDKIRRVVEHYGIENEDDFDDETKEGYKIKNELKRVPFIKVADSFTEFLNNCRVVSISDAASS